MPNRKKSEKLYEVGTFAQTSDEFEARLTF